MAATAPVSSALPSAVAHCPTATSVADPFCWAVKVVAAVAVTVTVVVVGEAVAVDEAVPRARAVSWTVIVSPLTALTRPATARRPAPAPPRAPVPVVADPVGAPAGGVRPAPGAPPPKPPNPPQSPLTAGRTSIDAAVMAAAGADVADPEPLAGGSRTVTHDPTVTSARVAVATLVNVVAPVHVTAVWSVRVCTCIVDPLTAAMSPVTPGCR